MGQEEPLPPRGLSGCGGSEEEQQPFEIQRQHANPGCFSQWIGPSDLQPLERVEMPRGWYATRPLPMLRRSLL